MVTKIKYFKSELANYRYVWNFKTYGAAKKYILNAKSLRWLWGLFWVALPVPVISAVIGALAPKIIKKDVFFIWRYD